MGKKTYRFCNLRKLKDFNKKHLTLLKITCTNITVIVLVVIIIMYVARVSAKTV